MTEEAKVVFIDTETTGLDPYRHRLWDIAVIDSSGAEFQFFLAPELQTADPRSLEIGHYWDRVTDVKQKSQNPYGVAEWLAKNLRGAHIVGAVPSFDAAFLQRFMHTQGFPATWHYHLIDIEVLIAGKLGIKTPWKSDELSRAIGVEPPSDSDRHTALGDAHWVKRMYEAVYS